MSDALKDGRFVILGALGEGGQGHTFDGVDKREGRAVAIKRFDIRTAKSWKDAELAEREARVLQSLSHPKLPHYFDHFEEGGSLYLVMEKIEGANLAALRKRGDLFSEADVVRFLRDASDVLTYLHGRTPPVIHRDLKPGNVLRRSDGSFAFVDFGAVRDKLRQDGGSTVVGTFGFMAPEQFQGRALPASDVYAIGATVLTMLTGQQPEDLPHKGLAIDVRGALGGRVSPRLIEALATMLDPDPDRRPSCIEPILARVEGRDRPPERAPASNRRGGEERESPFVRRAEDYEERANEYERRASSGAPDGKRLLRAARGLRREARKLRRADQHRARLEQYASYHSRHLEMRAMRFADRVAERAVRRHGRGRHAIGPLLAVLFSFGLLVAMLAVSIATRVVVPTVLRILSLFFATRALRDAANAVRSAGSTAIEQMDRSRHWLFSQRADDTRAIDTSGSAPASTEDERIRVASGVADKVRVHAGETGEADDEETEGASGSARR